MRNCYAFAKEDRRRCLMDRMAMLVVASKMQSRLFARPHQAIRYDAIRQQSNLHDLVFAIPMKKAKQQNTGRLRFLFPPDQIRNNAP